MLGTTKLTPYARRIALDGGHDEILMTTYRADLEQARSTRSRRRWRYVALFMLIAALFGGFGSYAYWRDLFTDMPALPPTEELWTMDRDFSIELVDRSGNVLVHRGPYYGRAVRPEDLPDHVVQAFIAGEDKRFYEHNGVDIASIFRAAFENWKAGRTVQGGSTLTQQLVKNLLLTPEQTIRRKAQEMRLAVELDARESKDEILALYLNRIFLGNRAYGLSGAAEVYFDKSPEDLTLTEATFIAALPKAPSRMSSDPDLEAARHRQNYILSQMVNQGYITPEQAREAGATPIEFAPGRGPEDPAMSHIADYVQAELTQILPELPTDAVVTITLDPDMQRMALAKLTETIESEGRTRGARNGAALVMDLSGRILVMVGGTDYETSKFNRATQAMRQPGSSFKPFVYATAMEAGLRPTTVRVDQHIYITPDWAPRNYDGRYYGPVRLRDALANSLNTVSAQLTREVGASNVVEMAHRLGLGTELHAYPSIALGSDETTLLDMVRAYGAFARNGQRMDPWLIERVENSRGELIYERKPYPAASVLAQRVVGDMNEMLRRVVTNGSGGRASLEGWEVAGKTGTSQEWRDAWFIGYTSQLIGGVWLGNDENDPMSRVTGGSLPAQIWHNMMEVFHRNHTPAPLAGLPEERRLTSDQLRRVEFFDQLSAAFLTNQPTRVAGLSTQPQ